MANELSQKRCLSFFIFFGAAALSACGDGNHTPPGSGAFRLANGVSDSGGLHASIASVPTVGPVDFDAASGITIVPEGSYRVHLTPDASGGAAYDIDGVGISQDTLTTLFATGAVTNGGPPGGLTASVSVLTPPSGQVRMQVVYAYGTAPDSQNYGFEFEPVGGSGQANDASATFGSVGPSQVFALAPGKYEIKVTGGPICNPGVACPAIGEFLFDSGPQGVDIPGSSGANVFQLAVIAANASQVSQYGVRDTLLLLDNEGGSKLLLNGQQ